MNHQFSSQFISAWLWPRGRKILLRLQETSAWHSEPNVCWRREPWNPRLFTGMLWMLLPPICYRNTGFDLKNTIFLGDFEDTWPIRQLRQLRFGLLWFSRVKDVPRSRPTKTSISDIPKNTGGLIPTQLLQFWRFFTCLIHMLWIFWATQWHCQTIPHLPIFGHFPEHVVWTPSTRSLWRQTPLGFTTFFSIGLMVDEHNTAMDIWWTIDGINFLGKNSPKIPRVIQEISRRSTVSIQHIHRLRKKHIRSPSNLRDGSANTQRGANESRWWFFELTHVDFFEDSFQQTPKKKMQKGDGDFFPSF